MSKKLRLGILIKSLEIPEWAYRALERLAESQAVESICLVQVSGPKREESTRSIRGKKNHLLYDLFNWLDEKMFVRSLSSFEPKDIREIFPTHETIPVKTRNHGGLLEIDPADVIAIQMHGLDILVDLNSAEFCPEIFSAAKYGLWSYIHSDERQIRGGPAGYWEVIEGYPETGAGLKIQTIDRDHSEVICRSYYFTYPLSPARNRNILYGSAAMLLPRQVEALHRLGEQRFFEQAGRFSQESISLMPRMVDFPTNLQAMRHYFCLFRRGIREIGRRFFSLPVWHLQYAFDAAFQSGLQGLKPIHPPNDRFWADPQVVALNDRYYIFVEEFFHRSKKGHISVIEMDGDGNSRAPVCVLEKKYHLSYPFVFGWQGKYYMVPELSRNHSIDLFECVDFPYHWKFRLCLMKNVRAADTTLFFDQGVWWMFTALSEFEGTVMPAELFLYYSDDLFSTYWAPHPSNPIVSDIRKARPAGRIFRKDGKTYRPSQYTSGIYGYGLDLNEITLLSKTDFAEKQAFSIRPDRNSKVQAMHTYSTADRLTMVDAFIQRKRFQWLP